jgi:acyl-[acyl-carrier-protein]-phospholipid O-acyltransferase/long-chain-fatty-acid--[acyl-carrier-protein] ligase
MVSLAAVEEAINALWPDNKSAAISLPDERKGEQIVLYTDKAGAQQSEMINYFKQRGLAEIYLPRKINIVTELPLLGSGKTDYTRLKKQAMAETVAEPV